MVVMIVVVIAVISSAYFKWGRHPWRSLPSIDGRPVGGKKAIYEMYGVILWGGLPSIEIPPIYGR